MRLAIFGNPYQGTYRSKLSALFSTLAEGLPDVAFRFERSFYDWLLSRGASLPHDAETFGPGHFEADMCLSFGGDGTLMRTARRVGASGIPVMGINTGHLGYLTTAGIDDPAATASILISGCYHIEERSMLRATVYDGVHETVLDALNEIAVTRQDTASMIKIHALVNGSLLADYRADGLIVSTPTGSTGYNLSVGGPVIAPSSPVLSIAPIAAHTLTMRPLILPDTVSVDLAVESRSGSFLLSNDGQPHVLRAGLPVNIVRAPFATRIVVAEHHSFVDTLRDKLSWGV